MSKDRFHHIVKIALQKDNWRITHDPLPIQADLFTEMYIDLGAEHLLAAERDGQKIAVEIKSFLGISAISEFHTAMGQFGNYRYALEDQDPDRTLYLAISAQIYDTFFQRPFIQSVIQRSQVKLIVYDIDQEVITQWLN